jgi:hypothetical protein
MRDSEGERRSSQLLAVATHGDRLVLKEHIERRVMATEQLGSLPPVLQPEEGASFWRPQPTNGYVTVKTSPSYGGPATSRWASR